MATPRRRGGRLAALLICILLGIGFGVWHNRSAANGRSDPFTSTVRTITAPFVNAYSGASRWIGRQLGWLLHGRSTDEENRRLRAENEYLKGEVARLHEAEATAARLEKQVGFAASVPPRKIAARVISFKPSPYIDSLVIDRGSRDGVHAGTVVTTPAGLVGQVLEAGGSSSVVLLLTDERSSAGGMIQRPDSRAVGVCRGDRSELLSLLYLGPEASVRVGDAIVTSGLGGAEAIYPKGVMIGTVSQVSGDASGAGLRVKIRPAVDPSRVEEVFLLQ